MTRRLFHSDPYARDFEAVVTEVHDDWVALDQTAFYPGGGGQEPDRGVLGGSSVVDVKQEKEAVLHKVPGHRLKVGERVQGAVDWERRYDLMRGHSGEHLLFSCLSRLHPELELVKIAITPEKKSVMVKGALDWELVARAEAMAREAIDSDLPIREKRVSKDDPVLRDARAKLDRIHGDEVRIVEIGSIDRAACAGIHVKSTKELELMLVTKFTSARPAGDFEVEFEVGPRAKQRAIELSVTALRAAEALGARPQDLLSALENLSRGRQRQELALKQYGAKALADLVPSEIGGIRLYSGIFESMDKKTLIDAANEFILEGAACVLGSTGEGFTLIVACAPAIKVDCVAVLNEALGRIGGRGGGRPSFASGGAPRADRAEEAMVAAIVGLRKALEGPVR
jgi:alanyl-tRNA synthetase